MIVVYTPGGGEPQHYDASSLKVSEAAIVQRTVDMKWQEILGGLQEDDLEAMRGIVWVIRKRSEPSLRWGDFDPGVLELTSRMDNGEIERWIATALAAADEEVPWDTVEEIIGSRLDEVAVDPERARAFLAAQAPGPKEPTPEADGRPVPEETPGEETSPSPTSNAPEPPTSHSSDTSSPRRRKTSTTSRSSTSTT
ncbi:hypothetical protein ACLVWQ_17530 (plasmid) [Streptomyces sp. CWNU-52B]|uniref:hypothetical protein n=1 Tax=unclassified Streptomyces TaxID=2593676 RepID=UPI0039C2E546